MIIEITALGDQCKVFYNTETGETTYGEPVGVPFRASREDIEVQRVWADGEEVNGDSMQGKKE